MPNTPFSTTRTWVVARNQHVRLDFNLLDGKERPVFMPGSTLGQQSTLKWLDNRTAIFTAIGNELLTGASFQLCTGLGDWKPGSGVLLSSLPNLRYDNIRIDISPNYAQSPEQQAREAVLPGAVAGPDPRLAQLKTQVGALKSFVDGL